MANINRLKNWDETLAGMNVIKFVRIRRDQQPVQVVEEKQDEAMEA